jgi:hypothetical protein
MSVVLACSLQTGLTTDLRELPEPVFNMSLAERVKYTENRGESHRLYAKGKAD